MKSQLDILRSLVGLRIFVETASYFYFGILREFSQGDEPLLILDDSAMVLSEDDEGPNHARKKGSGLIIAFPSVITIQEASERWPNYDGPWSSIDNRTYEEKEKWS